ncbi:MAG: cellulose biosynthesis cyclic di-GMP-binding regulatory protein BcsB [bacterium]|nr:cellulose biosynthesis cyclic di-GMP-binding regulatory protein BcsB [bacterium]
MKFSFCSKNKFIKSWQSYLLVLFQVVFLSSVHGIGAQEMKDENKYFTVQISSFPLAEKDKAINMAENFLKKGIKDIRVEKIGDYYIVRAGLFKEKKEAEQLLKEVLSFKSKAFLRIGYYIPDRIIYPLTEKTVDLRTGNKIFLQSKVYKIPLFKEEKSFVFPLNEYSYWFYLNPKLKFTSPAYVSLVYTCSSALLKNKGFITVLLNDHPVASRRFPSASGDSLPWKVELPIKFFKKGFNEIKIVSRHYTTEELCADSENIANWIRWSPESFFVITRGPVKNLYLSLYPFPYLDSLDVRPVQSIWVLDKKFGTFDAGLIFSLASNWGLNNITLPLRFRVTVGEKTNSNNEMYFQTPEESETDNVKNKEIGYISNSIFYQNGKTYAKMAISGSNKQGYKKAVDSLNAAMTTACDSTFMSVSNVPEGFIPQNKAPYQKVTFAEMGIHPILIEGTFLKEANVLINRPIMTPIGKESYIMIKFKHSAILRPEMSVLTILINNIYVGSVRLTEENKDKGEILLPIPLNLLGEPAWLIKFKVFHYIGTVDCGKGYKELAWTLIEDTSYINFSKGYVNGYPHINYFPYVRHEHSLTPKEVTMWLPENLTENQLTTAAIVAARAGQINRIPLTWNVIFGDKIDDKSLQNCIILIREPEDIKNIKEVAEKLHILPVGTKIEINPQLPVVEQSIRERIIVQAIESPWNKKCVLYAIIARDRDLKFLDEVLLDKDKYDKFIGDVALVTSSLDVYSFNTVSIKILEEIEKEKNKYTPLMKIILIVAILAILTGLFFFIKLFLRALSKKPK